MHLKFRRNQHVRISPRGIIGGVGGGSSFSRETVEINWGIFWTVFQISLVMKYRESRLVRFSVSYVDTCHVERFMNSFSVLLYVASCFLAVSVKLAKDRFCVVF